jgi:hypothetical protein
MHFNVESNKTGNIRARNILAPFCNNFAVETQQCNCVCVVVVVNDDDDELRVTIKYIKLLNITQQFFFMVGLCHQQQHTLHVPFEIIYVSTYLNFLHNLNKKCIERNFMFVCSWPYLGLKFG